MAKSPTPVSADRILESIDGNENINELNDIIARATARRDDLVSTKTRTFWDKIRSEAEAAGLDPDDVLAVGKSLMKPVRVGQGGTYRHPTDPTLKWGGQGRMPKWCHEYIAVHGEDAFYADCKVKEESAESNAAKGGEVTA